jgi:hypothetical protein
MEESSHAAVLQNMYTACIGCLEHLILKNMSSIKAGGRKSKISAICKLSFKFNHYIICLEVVGSFSFRYSSESTLI